MQEAMNHLLVGIEQHVCAIEDISRIAGLLESLTYFLSKERGKSCPDACCKVMQTLVRLWQDLLTIQDLPVDTHHCSNLGNCLVRYYMMMQVISSRFPTQIFQHRIK